MPCKQFYAGKIPHERNDLVPCFVGLFAVLLYGADDELMNTRRFPLRVPFGGKQTDFRIAPRPEAQPVKPRPGFAVCFQPYKGNGLIGKAPCADQAQGFGKLRKGRPKKKCAVPFCKFGNGKRT